MTFMWVGTARHMPTNKCKFGQIKIETLFIQEIISQTFIKVREGRSRFKRKEMHSTQRKEKALFLMVWTMDHKVTHFLRNVPKIEEVKRVVYNFLRTFC